MQESLPQPACIVVASQARYYGLGVREQILGFGCWYEGCLLAFNSLVCVSCSPSFAVKTSPSDDF